MSKKRRILFVTERRADYSRLKPIMKAVKESRRLELLLIVTGMHLLKSFGLTEEVVRRDGFRVDAKLSTFTEKDTDSCASMVKAIGRALIKLPEILDRLKPDFVFTGFDIGANFSAAVAGMHLNIPVAHIQGGEVTGSIDEVIRHALTKFAHIHFAATKKSAERIIKLGENPKYVFLVGSPSMDTIHHLKYFSPRQVCLKYGLDPAKKLIIFVQHPVTTEVDRVVWQIKQSVVALKKIKELYKTEVLAVYSNNDAGGRRIINQLKKAEIKILPNIVFEDFLRLLKIADVLVGNSSAGIHEAPSFGLPTVNIGSRQQHRERGINVLDTDYGADRIIKAIEKALFDKKFIQDVKKGKNPYDHGDTAKKVVKILEKIEFPPIQKVITY